MGKALVCTSSEYTCNHEVCRAAFCTRRRDGLSVGRIAKRIVLRTFFQVLGFPVFGTRGIVLFPTEEDLLPVDVVRWLDASCRAVVTSGLPRELLDKIKIALRHGLARAETARRVFEELYPCGVVRALVLSLLAEEEHVGAQGR